MLSLFKYMPAILAIQGRVEAQIESAKADDGKVTPDELFDIALGCLVAVAEVFFPHLGDALQARIAEALTGAGNVRDKVAEGYALTSEALSKADEAYSQIEGIIQR